jgi:hypothetical protein
MTIELTNDSRGRAGSSSVGRRKSCSAGGRRHVAILSLLLMTMSGCGSDAANPQSEEPSATEDPSRDFTTFDVTWRDDAVVLDELSEVQRSLRRADYEKGELVFSADYAGLDQLEMGRFALLGGIGIFQVVGREDVEDGVLVTVEPGVLTDVIEDGTIAWRRSFVSAADDTKLGLGIDEDETENIRSLKEPLGSYDQGKLEYSGNIAGFDTTFELERTGNVLSFEATSKQDSKGNSIANAAVKGTLRGLTSETNIIISARTLSDFTVKFLNVDGEVEIEAGAVELGILDTKVQIPARLSLPIVIGGIPFRVDLGGSLEWASTLQATCSAIFKGRTKFRGGVGARMEGGSVTPLATFDSAETVMGMREHVGTVEAGLSLVMSFPEFGIGVGMPKIASADALFRFKSEVISNFSLAYSAAGSVPVISGNCMTSRANFGATLNGKVAMLGLTLAEKETALFSELGRQQRTGNACD